MNETPQKNENTLSLILLRLGMAWFIFGFAYFAIVLIALFFIFVCSFFTTNTIDSFFAFGISTAIVLFGIGFLLGEKL